MVFHILELQFLSVSREILLDLVEESEKGRDSSKGCDAIQSILWGAISSTKKMISVVWRAVIRDGCEPHKNKFIMKITRFMFCVLRVTQLCLQWTFHRPPFLNRNLCHVGGLCSQHIATDQVAIKATRGQMDFCSLSTTLETPIVALWSSTDSTDCHLEGSPSALWEHHRGRRGPISQQESCG